MRGDALGQEHLVLRNAHAKEYGAPNSPLDAIHDGRVRVTEKDSAVRAVVVEIAVTGDILNVRAVSVPHADGGLNVPPRGIDAARNCLGCSLQEVARLLE
jgi:hypothetical protein